MLKIKDSIDKDIINKFFLSDPALCYLGLSDSVLNMIYYNGEYTPEKHSTWLGIYEKDELVCLVKYEWYTTVTINLHFYVKTSLQKQGYTKKIQKLLYKYFIAETKAIKVILQVPCPCTHVVKPAKEFGMEHEGTIKSAVMWRNELVDILLFGLVLKREN